MVEPGRFAIDIEEFMDWLILVSYSFSGDSAGKNSYLYHGDEGDGALAENFRFIPWDFNDSWGQQWQTSRTDPTENQDWTISHNRVFAALQRDSGAAALLWQRFARLRADGPLNPAWLLATIDGYERLIADHIERDWGKWGSQILSRFRRGSLEPAAELSYLRGWIGDRDAYWGGNRDQWSEPTPLPAVAARPASTCDEARWPDVTAVCGECKALVDRIDTEYGGGCEGFCAAVGLQCAAVWEERKDTCEAKRGVGCGVSLGDTHDAICSCMQ